MKGVLCRGCSNTGYDLAGKPCGCGLVEPITAAWLSARGWKLDSSRNDPNHRNPGFRIRPVSEDCRGWRRPFQAHDDLCIGLAPVGGDAGEWFVWVYQVEPYRHIHVRHMRYVWEVVKLWEGLTGRAWPEGGAR